ncbi:MAG: RnfABCDGE type electron transport complex subunit G [Mediterranea sp.]|jgi:electron transport complex protein RnfG|nr:RnfABCDGE type electron transport complex subunit G [Mediterranea sp.]
MKKLESSLKNMLLVLTGITVISVGLLAYVNELTKDIIVEANKKALNEALKSVVPEFTNNPVGECDTLFSEKDGKKTVDFIVYPAKNGDQLVGVAIESVSLGFGGELKVLVGFDAEGNIYDYSLLSHSETPGLGSKAADWFKEGNKGSIKGLNPGKKPLTVSKDGGEIDAITASTVTSRAFLSAVNKAYAAYKGNTDGTTSATQTEN